MVPLGCQTSGPNDEIRGHKFTTIKGRSVAATEKKALQSRAREQTARDAPVVDDGTSQLLKYYAAKLHVRCGFAFRIAVAQF